MRITFSEISQPPNYIEQARFANGDIIFYYWKTKFCFYNTVCIWKIKPKQKEDIKRVGHLSAGSVIHEMLNEE